LGPKPPAKTFIEEDPLRRTVLVLAALAFALTACEFRAEIAIDDDGSGTFATVFAMEPEMIALFNESGFGGDPFDDLKRDLADDPVVWEVDEFKEGRLTGIRATFTFESIDDLLDKVDAMSTAEGDGSALEDFTVARQGGGWTFEGSAADPQEELSKDSPIPLDQLENILKFQFRLTLPGRAADHNADQAIAGNGKTTFVWTPSLKEPAPDFRASTTPSGGAATPVLPSVLALAALVIVAITWLRRVRAPAPQPGFSLPSDVIEAVAGVRRDDDDVSGGSKESASLSS
jgi:hypothetical protein